MCVCVSGTYVWLKRQRTADTCQAVAAASCLGTRGERNDWRIIGFLPDAESRVQQGATWIVPPGIRGWGQGGTVRGGGGGVASRQLDLEQLSHPDSASSAMCWG